MKKKKKEKKKEEKEEEFVDTFLQDEKTPSNTNQSSSSSELAPLPADEMDWDSLDLTPQTKLGINELGFESMMPIQAQCIPLLLKGENLVGAAKTGSGKTLAYLIPVVDRLTRMRWDSLNKGVGAIIIVPTRELGIQIQNVCKIFRDSNPDLKVGLLIGGNPKPTDYKHILDGIDICIATPGRLLDHISTTKEFITDQVQMFVMDEADRILEEGYQDEVNEILKKLPKERQTMLFSATQTRSTEDLIRLSFSAKPHFVSVDEKAVEPTREDLEQGYIVIPAEKKLLLLFSFVKKYRAKKKIIVFFSTVNATKYMVDLFKYIDLPVYGLFGAMSQRKRTDTFMEFLACKIGVLFATNVAARGLDIPNVDWIIQYDPPDDLRDYIHRVGRTCRGKIDGKSPEEQKKITKKGKALLFLIPKETRYLDHLRKNKITSLKEYDFPLHKIANIQSQLEKITSTVYHLHVGAHEAYIAYMKQFGLRNSKVFDVLSLDIVQIAKSFGLSAPPKVSIELKRNKSHGQKVEKRYKQASLRLKTNEWAKRGRKSQFKFSPENPYGK